MIVSDRSDLALTDPGAYVMVKVARGWIFNLMFSHRTLIQDKGSQAGVIQLAMQWWTKIMVLTF